MFTGLVLSMTGYAALLLDTWLARPWHAAAVAAQLAMCFSFTLFMGQSDVSFDFEYFGVPCVDAATVSCSFVVLIKDHHPVACVPRSKAGVAGVVVERWWWY